MNKFEEMKKAKDGLDVWHDIVRYAQEGTPIEEIPPEDLDRMKWYGVFHRRLTPGFFMMRLRISGGRLFAHQAEAIAAVAEEYGRGTVDLTTRQSIQLRWLTLDVVPGIIARLGAVGVCALQTGMDNLRNYVSCPLAGVDGDELIDTRPILDELARLHLGRKEYSNLPRKFNFSVTGCREDCGHAQTQDLGLLPAARTAGGREVLGFNVLVGGALGGTDPKLAEPMDVFLEPAEVPGFVLAVLRVFRDHGPREARTRARLRWLLAEWGMERFRAAVEAAFGRQLAPEGRHLTERVAGDHLGVRRERDAHTYSVGLHVPVGRMTAAQLREVARLAVRYGSGEIRLTNGQNVVLVHVPEERLAPLLEEPLLLELTPNPTPVWRGLVVCTGNDYCHYSLIDTKGRAVELARRLEARGVELPEGTRIHISGCVNGCGKHRIADVGIEGTKVRRDGEQVEAAQVFVGGKLGLGCGRVARRFRDDVTFDELVDVVVEACTALDPARGGETERLAAGGAVA